MILCGFVMMFGGVLARNQVLRVFPSNVTISCVSKQQTLRTVSEVTVLMGGMLLCLGMLTGAKLLASPVERPRRADAPQPAPASERAFADRLTQFLEEGPTPAVQTGRDPSRSFFLAMLPGARRGPKSPSAIRAILKRIHQLLRGGP